jgi:hypothetical protein
MPLSRTTYTRSLSDSEPVRLVLYLDVPERLLAVTPANASKPESREDRIKKFDYRFLDFFRGIFHGYRSILAE